MNNKEKEYITAAITKINKDYKENDDLVLPLLLEDIGLLEDCTLPSKSSKCNILWKYCQ